MKIFVVAICAFLLAQKISAQCPYGGSLSGVELVTNSNFSSGNTGFTSSYTYCNSYLCLYPEAYYAVGANPTLFHDAFHGNDHTTGSGKLMIVNGAGTANVDIWCETMTVQPFAKYVFSYWLSSMVTSSPAQLQVSVNSTLIGSIATAPSSTYTWEQHTETWNAGINTSAEVCIVNQNTDLGGNDFGLDDISFQQCICSSIVADAGPDQSICIGDTSQLAASGGAIYAWQSSTFISDTSISSPDVFPPATSTFFVTIMDSSGCTGTDSATVYVNPLPAITISDDTSICFGNSANLFASGGVDFSWSPSATLNNPLVSNPIAAPDSTTDYTVTVTDGNGCKATDSVLVKVLDLPVVAISDDTTICRFTSAILTAGGGISYAWSTGASGSSIEVEPLADSAYSVLITDTNNCTSTASTHVFIAPPFLTLSGDTEICMGAFTALSGNGALTYLWNNGATTASINVSPPTETTYTLIGFDGSCNDTAEITVLVDPLPSADAGPDTVIEFGSSVSLNASGGISATWSPDISLSCAECLTTVANPVDTMIYYVTVTDANGCSAVDSVIVYVKAINQIFIPNAFTPNGDGLNDVFLPVLSGRTEMKTLAVFNRWGQQVFFSSSPATGWDGTFDGKPEEVGAFVYYFTGFNEESGKEIVMKGNVLLLR
ncbi:MAG: gliding motility-associated C-terminal domain-containing protein [Chitinophagales bacterium]|nr:gliding motility-associated C-terminal domain-containing protein [Chitinophagales bacterium]